MPEKRIKFIALLCSLAALFLAFDVSGTVRIISDPSLGAFGRDVKSGTQFSQEFNKNGGACPTAYKTIDTDIYEGYGKSCGGKWENFRCRSDLKTCYSPMEGFGKSCNGKYVSCKCSSEYKYASDSECPNGYVKDQSNICDGKSSGCLPASCSNGYTSNLTGCSEGYTFEKDPIVSVLNCGKCIAKTCPYGYSTSYQSLNDCPNQSGYSFSSSGTAGSDVCGKCTVKDCPNGYSTLYQSSNDCPNPNGYDFFSFGKSGSQVCGQCKIRSCSSDYSTTITVADCGAGYKFISSGYSGEKACGKCTTINCASGYTTVEKTCDIGYEFTENGYSGDLPCSKCVEKPCPAEFPLKAHGFGRIAGARAGLNTCTKTLQWTACEGYYQHIMLDPGGFFNCPGTKVVIGYFEDMPCVMCLDSACPEGYDPLSSCPITGWINGNYTYIDGYTYEDSGVTVKTVTGVPHSIHNCGKCVNDISGEKYKLDSKCQKGYHSTFSVCPTGYSREELSGCYRCVNASTGKTIVDEVWDDLEKMGVHRPGN